MQDPTYELDVEVNLSGEKSLNQWESMGESMGSE